MRVRDHRGQTSTDYLGALLLVGMIIAALVSTDVPGALAGDVERLVCKIAGQECAATDDGGGASSPTTANAQERPVDGPAPIPDGPLVVLPFPGSVSVKCSNAKESEKRCKGSGIAVHTGELKVERSPTKLDAKGCPQQTLAVSTTFKLESTLPAGGAKAGGSLTTYVGRTSRYAVTVPPDQADAIEAGERGAPNPVDPRTIRPGESVQLNEEFYRGHSQMAQYRGIQAQLGYDEGRRVSSGVTRVDDSTVRVFVGDEDFVRNAMTLGIGFKSAKLSVGRATELSEGKLHGIDIDISTPAGWTAYQQFVTTGTLPKSRTPGTSNPARSETTKVTASTAFEAELGPVKGGTQLSDEEATIIDTTYPNGSGERARVGRVNDMGVEIITSHDADGDPIGQPSYALNLEGVDKDMWDSFQYFSGGTTSLPPDGNVRLELSPSDVDALRRQAADALAFGLKTSEGWSDDELADLEVTSRGIRVGEGEWQAVPAGLEFAGFLASSDLSADDLVLALWRRGFDDPDDLIAELRDFAQLVEGGRGSKTRFPGSVRQPDCD